MADSTDSLADFHRRTVVLLGTGRSVLVSGSGPAVVLLGGADATNTIRVARRLRSVQFTGYVLLEAAAPAWLRALARLAHRECGDPGVGLLVPDTSRDVVAGFAREPCVAAIAFLADADAAAATDDGAGAWHRFEHDLVAFFRARLYPPHPFAPETVI
jgi:hypothetical protein